MKQSRSNHMDQVKLSNIRVIGEKAAAMEAQGREIVRLQVGEPDFDPPIQVIEQTIQSLLRRETHYTPNRGTMELRREIAAKLKRDNGIDCDPATDIIVVAGCAEALFCAVNGLTGPGDEVIIIEPAFLSYRQIVTIARATPIIVRAREENGWLPDLSDLRNAVTPNTRMLILNSPNNPTGASYPRELMEQIAALAKERDLFVVADEVYEKLIYEGEHTSIASLEGMWERTVTINGFSKAYAMTGYRLGYLAAPKELILPMLKVHQYTSTCLPAFAQQGGVIALKSCDEDVQEMRAEYRRRRDLLMEYFDACGAVSVVKPVSTFYMYLNISKTGMDSDAFMERLLQEEGVTSVPDTAFDQAGRDNIRISFASDEESLRKGAEGICRLAGKG